MTETSESSRFARIKAWLGRTRKEREVEASLREAIEELIEERETAEPIADDERALIGNVLKLRTLTARDVMVPRSDIDALEIDTSVPDLVKHMTGSGHSRVPVYRGTLDDVLGMVHIKDVLTAVAEGRQVTLRRLLRKVMFVSPAMRTMDMMIEMRAAKTHMALVVDEFGGVDGLVTWLAGHLPVRGEVIRHPSGIEFEVVEADARRVKRLRVLNAPVANVPAK